MFRWYFMGRPSAHCVPRPISEVSSNPSVTSRPSLGPFRSISRFIASVVEYRMMSVSASSEATSTPSRDAASAMASFIPTDRS